MFGYYFDVFKLDIEGKLPDSFWTKFVSSAYSDASLGHSKKKCIFFFKLVVSDLFFNKLSGIVMDVALLLWLSGCPLNKVISGLKRPTDPK